MWEKQRQTICKSNWTHELPFCGLQFTMPFDLSETVKEIVKNKTNK